MEDKGEDESSYCIGKLEHHIHKVFASVRVPGEDFVYHPNAELFAGLENYCNDNNGTGPPLLVIGESGLGKSALLSNWLERRFRNVQRLRTTEFVFWHAVGCSRQSSNVSNLIRRLIVDLKDRFELTRDVPVRKERLSWELPRFLDMAAKKGKIIIVIDGVNRLLSDDNTEASLAWLPLELPQNVRFVMSVTIPKTGSVFDEKPNTAAEKPHTAEASSSSGTGSNHKTSPDRSGSPIMKDPSRQSVTVNAPQTTISVRPAKKSRILAELERRPWQLLRVRPLDQMQCRALIISFIQKTVQSEASSLATSVTSFFLTSMPRSRQADQDKISAVETIPGFILFECHIRSLQSHPAAGVPLFLRLFLRCAYLVCSKGFSLWRIWEDWLLADSVPALFERIMSSIEKGFKRIPEEAKVDIDRFHAEGGIAALRKLYPWHPALAPKVDEDTFAAIDFAVIAANDRPTHGPGDELASGKHSSSHTTTGSGSVLQSMADQQWLSAADSADQKFEAARVKTERMVGDVISSTRRHLRDFNGSLMAAVENSVQRIDLDAEEVVDPTNELLSSLNNTSINSVAGDINEIIAEDENEDDESLDSESEKGEDHDQHKDDIEVATNRSGSRGADSVDIEVSRLHSKGDSFHDEVTINPSFLTDSPTVEVEANDTSLMLNRRTAQTGGTTSKSETRPSSREVEAGSLNSGVSPRKRPTPSSSTTPPSTAAALSRGGSLAFLLQRGEGSKKSLSRRFDSRKDTTYVSEDNDSLHQPAYMIGGADVKGLDTLLGNALALLYVSRHGLMEHEMWALLAALSEEHYRVYDTSEVSSANSVRLHEAQRARDAWNNRNLILTLFAERGGIEDVWKTGDPLQSGYLPVKTLVKGLRQVRQDMKPSDFRTLLELLNLSGTSEITGRLFPFDSSSFVVLADTPDQMKVNYVELIRRLIHAASVAKRAEIKTKLTPKIFQDPDGLDNLEMFLLGGEAEERQAAHDGGGAHEDIDSWDNFSFNSVASAQAGKPLTMINSTSSKLSKETHLSLGPVVEEALLGVLCAFGILHSPENQFLLLPVDSKVCRYVVKKRYVARRGGETIWHDHLIRHFQREANSMRRCEELPWHLQLCRKWYSLKDTLTDLKTFDLMFNGDLKQELMEYWITLSEGPLFLTTEAARTAAAIQSRAFANVNARQSKQPLLKGDPVERQLLLTEMDSALALGLSDKEAKLHLMKDRIASFDVVEEYNRALENWIFRAHPNSILIQKVVSQIASFMAQFSSMLRENPIFLRLGVDLKALQQFGINFEELKELDSTIVTSQMDDGIVDGNTVAVAEQNQFPTPSQLAGNYYPYIRWVWVQFPWLCMKQAAEVGKKIFEQKQHGYIMPPTIARANATGSTDATATTGKEVDDDLSSSSPARYSVAMSPMKSPTERYWKTLKCDPNLPVIAMSPLRVQSNIQATLKPTSSALKIMERSAQNIHQEDCRLFGGKVGHPPHLHLSASKYRRTMEEEAEISKGIPYSDHCVRSVKQNTLFPTIEHLTKERNAKVELNDMTLYQKAAEVERRGGKMEIFEISLAEELKLLMEQERLSFINSLQANPFPLSEFQAEFQNEVNRLHKMRSLADRAIQMRRQRKALLNDLKRQINSREQDDLVAAASIVSGEQAIEAATNRLQVLSDALQEATEITLGYEKILDLVAHTPPYHDSHLAEVEGNLALARQQLQDMIQCRKNIVIDGERAAGIKTKQLEQKIQYYHEARVKLAKKRRSFLATHGVVEEEITLIHPLGKVPVSSREKLLAKAKSRKSTASAGGKGAIGLGETRAQAASFAGSGGKAGGSGKPAAEGIKLSPGRLEHGHDSKSSRVHRGVSSSSLDRQDSEQSVGSKESVKPEPVILPVILESLVGAFKKASDEVLLNQDAVASITESDEEEDEEMDAEARKLMEDVALVKYQLANNEESKDNESSSPPQSRGRSRLLAAMHAVTDAAHATHVNSARHHHHRKRKTKISFDRESLLVKPVDAFNKKGVIDKTLAQSHETACRLQLEFIVEKTGSVNEAEFLDRFYNSQKMKESLKAMQNLGDSKLAQLRAEHSELAGSLGKSRFQIQDQNANKMDIFVAGATHATTAPTGATPTAAGTSSEGTTVASSGAPAPTATTTAAPADDGLTDHDARYFDNRLFASEMRLSSLQRLLEKTVLCINEVRTGTLHLMDLINVNAKLLHALPKSVPPPLNDSEDIVKCLNWCEERLLGVNEAMMLDSSKPGLETDSNKSLFERQTELAALVQRMSSANRTEFPSVKRRPGKNAGDMSRVLIDPGEHGGNFVSDPRGIVVPSDGKVDEIYEREMKKLTVKRNQHADEVERAMASAGLGSTQGLSEFLSEALSTPESLEALRKANAVTRSVQGERAGFGYTLETMLKADLPPGSSPPKLGKISGGTGEETSKDRAWSYWDQQVRASAEAAAAARKSGSPKVKKSHDSARDKLSSIPEGGESGNNGSTVSGISTVSGNMAQVSVREQGAGSPVMMDKGEETEK